MDAKHIKIQRLIYGCAHEEIQTGIPAGIHALISQYIGIKHALCDEQLSKPYDKRRAIIEAKIEQEWREYNQWDNGIFSCCDIDDICCGCYVYCCPCCAAGNIYYEAVKMEIKCVN